MQTAAPRSYGDRRALTNRLQRLAVLGLLALSGCAGMGTPTLAPQGSLAQQRASAQRFDPYPEQGTGPEISEGRPRDYDREIAETRRARWNPPRPYWSQ